MRHLTDFRVATAKPAATAVKASITGNAMGRRRATNAITQQSAASPDPAHHAGSRSAAK
jgi:hypothetical protein